MFMTEKELNALLDEIDEFLSSRLDGLEKLDRWTVLMCLWSAVGSFLNAMRKEEDDERD